MSQSTQRVLLSFLGLALLDCKPKGPPPVEPGDQERYELPSHRCAGKAPTCACRDTSDPADAPEKILVPEGERRFEIRLASVDPALLMSIAGQPYEFRTNGESAQPFCWYLDLPIGENPEVSLRAKEFKDIPIHASFAISEYHTEDKRWVPVIAMRCGSRQDGCGPDMLEAEKQNILDSRDPKCARTKRSPPHWTGKMVDDTHYGEMTFAFQLLVNPPNDEDPACIKVDPKKNPEEP